MILLDTDHISILRYPENRRHAPLVERMESALDADFVTSIVTFEEQMRAWMAALRRAKRVPDEPEVYKRLGELVAFFGMWRLLPFDLEAATQFQRLRADKVRIGTMDLKIASIALANDALLLSSNLRDFEQVPGLQVEDWVY